MAEGRIGLPIGVGSFVVAEEKNLRARLERVLLRSHGQIRRGTVLARLMRRKARGTLPRLRLPVGLPDVAQARPLLRDAWVAIRDAGLLLGLILRYAMTRPLHGSEAEQTGLRSNRKTLVILVLAMIALGFALLLPDRDQQAVASEPRIAAVELPATTAEPPSVEPKRNPEPVLLPEQRPWQPVRQPMALYHLESSELAGLSLTYRVSMRGPSRQDSLIWQPRNGAGEAEPRRAAALLVIERHEGPLPTEKPLFADIAARAAEHRLVLERMARPQDIQTKFGSMEAAEASFRQENALLSCLAFRRIDMAGVTLVGWFCGTPQRPVDRVSASCFLDRLDLVGGGRDTVLRKFFAEAERSRQNCASSRQPGRRLTWMDHEAPIPALKLTARR